VSTEEFEADKSSLRRMLTDFEHDNAKVQLHADMHKIACTSIALYSSPVLSRVELVLREQLDIMTLNKIGAVFVVLTTLCYGVFHSNDQHNVPLTARRVSRCPKDFILGMHFVVYIGMHQWCLQLRQSAVAQPDAVPKTGPNGEELIMPGMEFMMECYEDELKRPIRNLVSGQLARSLLIQVLKWHLASWLCIIATTYCSLLGM